MILWADHPEQVRIINYWREGAGSRPLIPQVITAAGGWCAPGEGYLILPESLRPERWPPGLLPEDMEWLARMLWLGGIDPEPFGLRWPVSSGVTKGG